MLRLAPQVRIIDITHGVPPGDIAAGALLLAQSVPYLPTGVALAVVDPGVGTARRAVVVVARDGSRLVGPDNGLLVPAAEVLGGVTAAFQIQSPALIRPRPSSTFHGRDLFAPAAAHLALGVAPEEFGALVAPTSLVRLDPSPATVTRHGCSGTVTYVDRFGNLQTNVLPSQAAAAGLLPGQSVSIDFGPVITMATFGETFNSVPPGELVVLVDSHGVLAICINQGNAARALGIRAGSKVTLGPLGTSGGGSPG